MPAAEREFDQLLSGRRLGTLFQPIVHLGSGETVGYEALVRGPQDSVLFSADALLGEAYRTDRVVEFDWLARAAACRAAMAAGLPRDQLLFLNIEPLALDSECPADLRDDIEKAFGMYQVVLEVTERSLDRDPGSLLDGIDRQRRLVTGIALDDVGSDPATLSMLPLVAPAVIKLDVAVTQAEPTPEITQILDVVYEEAERTGATILAEGIEIARHRESARSLGATLGQGAHSGTPAPLPKEWTRSTQVVHLQADTPPAVATPFEALGASPIGRAGVDLLGPLSQQVGACRSDFPVPAFLIHLVPGPHMFGPAERDHLAGLAARGVMTAALGPGIAAEPGGGVRGTGARQEPGVVGEWAVIALGPCTAGAMLARSVDENNVEFEFGITHDTQRVIAAARCLFRLLGAPLPHFNPPRLDDA